MNVPMDCTSPKSIGQIWNSETGEAMPTKFGVHAIHINPYLHEFFELIL